MNLPGSEPFLMTPSRCPQYFVSVTKAKTNSSCTVLFSKTWLRIRSLELDDSITSSLMATVPNKNYSTSFGSRSIFTLGQLKAQQYFSWWTGLKNLVLVGLMTQDHPISHTIRIDTILTVLSISNYPSLNGFGLLAIVPGSLFTRKKQMRHETWCQESLAFRDRPSYIPPYRTLRDRGQRSADVIVESKQLWAVSSMHTAVQIISPHLRLLRLFSRISTTTSQFLFFCESGRISFINQQFSFSNNPIRWDIIEYYALFCSILLSEP